VLIDDRIDKVACLREKGHHYALLDAWNDVKKITHCFAKVLPTKHWTPQIVMNDVLWLKANCGPSQKGSM